MTIKQSAIEQTAKDLMPLESEFRRLGDEHDGRRGNSLHALSRELGNLVSYATNPATETGETLSRDWLEKTKAAVNTAVLAAQDAVGLGDPLWSRLTTARSLGYQLARLLCEVSEDGGTVVKYSRHRRVSEWIEVLKRLGDEISEDTFGRRRIGKAKPSYRVNPDSSRTSISLAVADLPSGYSEDM